MFVSTRPASVVRRAAIGSLVVALAAISGTPALRVTAASPPSPAGGVPAGMATLVAGAVDLGPLPPRPLDVTVTLPLRDRGGLDALIRAQNTPGDRRYRRFLTPRQFADRFAPEPATVARVVRWAAASGLTPVDVSSTRTTVRLRGDSDRIGRLLGVRIDSYRWGGGLGFFAPASAVRIPADLAGRVSAVVGLTDLDRLQVRLTAGRLHPAASGSFTGYSPQQFDTFYDAPARGGRPHRDGSGQTLAILAEGDLTGTRTDLVTFENTFALPHVAWTTVPVGTGPFTDTSAAPEWDLDTQYSTAFAPGVAHLLVYQAASLEGQDILDEINRWVADDRAPQASASFGECEMLAQQGGFETATDTALEQAVSQGQTLFVASGDNGSFCPLGNSQPGVAAGAPGVDYPSASPYVVSVGGTTLTPNGGGGAHEVAWSAGGGGPTSFEPVPSWQTAAGGSFSGSMRGTPDVSIDADPASGYAVITGGQRVPIGGTSAGAPSWLGIWARAQSAHAGHLGFAAPALYRLPASVFHDITEGFQGIYSATVGWDYTSGRGTPDIAVLITALNG